jgi:hypothetical protein
VFDYYWVFRNQGNGSNVIRNIFHKSMHDPCMNITVHTRVQRCRLERFLDASSCHLQHAPTSPSAMARQRRRIAAVFPQPCDNARRRRDIDVETLHSKAVSFDDAHANRAFVAIVAWFKTASSCAAPAASQTRGHGSARQHSTLLRHVPRSRLAPAHAAASHAWARAVRGGMRALVSGGRGKVTEVNVALSRAHGGPPGVARRACAPQL